MSCPTCDYKMQNIGTNRSHQVFWCPRCGTIRDQNPHSVDPCRGDAVPLLVFRCRDYYEEAIARETAMHANVWRRRGLSEAINLPNDRRLSPKETV